jgi:hypothetical protein
VSWLSSLLPGELLPWLAFGSGVGIEIAGPAGAESLRIAAARVRPGKARALSTLTIADASHHSAGVWGTEYSSFLRKLDLSHAAATVVLPRRDVIVRQLVLPGVPDKDLPAAIDFQMEGLHPYPEDEAVSGWARIPGTAAVLIAIARRSVTERYANLFAEAGVKIGSFTCSAPLIYSALRLLRQRLPATAGPVTGLLAYEATGTGVEVYGESPSRAVFSAFFDAPAERALALAASELRLDAATVPQALDQVLGVPAALPDAAALPYAAALASACPLFALPLNLLPADRRQSGSRLLWIPSAALGAAVLLLALALALFPRYETGKYLESLNAEIAKVTPVANRSSQLDARIAAARARTIQLDEMRGRTKADMDVLGEMTRILAPPSWLNQLEITRTQVMLAGETQQAAPLLQIIDSSPLFQGSEFTMAPSRVNAAEAFRIRTTREPGK